MSLFAPLPRGKFPIIYADPPWAYSRKEMSGRFASAAAAYHYPTVSLKDLKKLDVPSIATDDCLLFMWTTGPKLQEAMELGAAWGFEYKQCAFVWEKQHNNPGYYTCTSTEFVFAFKRGKIPSPRGARNVKQLVVAKRRRHSAKPEEVRRRIELMFPKQRKVELFARKKSKGWKVWGNQV